MKRTFVFLISAVCAALLAACAQTGANPQESIEVVITPDDVMATNQTTDAPSLPLLVDEGGTALPEPPTTVTGVVGNVNIDGEVIQLQMLYSEAEADIPLDITVDGDTMAVGDIYALDNESIVTATVSAWTASGAGYKGKATNLSVDNQSAVE